MASNRFGRWFVSPHLSHHQLTSLRTLQTLSGFSGRVTSLKGAADKEPDNEKKQKAYQASRFPTSVGPLTTASFAYRVPWYWYQDMRDLHVQMLSFKNSAGGDSLPPPDLKRHRRH